MRIYNYILILIGAYLLQFSIFPLIFPPLLQLNLVWTVLVLGMFLIRIIPFAVILVSTGLFVDAISTLQSGPYVLSYIVVFGGIMTLLRYSFRVYHPIIFLGIIFISTLLVATLATIIRFSTLGMIFDGVHSLQHNAVNYLFEAIFTTIASTAFLPLLRRGNRIVL